MNNLTFATDIEYYRCEEQEERPLRIWLFLNKNMSRLIKTGRKMRIEESVDECAEDSGIFYSMDDTNLQDEVSKFLSGFKMIYGNLNTTFQNRRTIHYFS